ncbi:MAG: hypothetical protein KAJ55_06640 [Anaerolineales bacterium]|jgi:hypothetical protein|nr:hypothetical protein [Anaerolineales bacterium]
MDDRKPPITLRLLTLFSFLLGIYLAVNGLAIRLFSWDPIAMLPGTSWLDPFHLFSKGFTQWIILSPEALAWPTIVLGAGLSGAVWGIWLHRRWGYGAAILINVLSLMFFGPATLLALCNLACIAAPATRAWVQEAESPDAG